MSQPPAVLLSHITKLFPVPFRREKVVAVRDLNLQIPQGQVYGLLGPNGSGKSTTLKILLGLVTPTHGRAEIFGQDSRSFASKARAGYLPENPYFYKFLTAEETLYFYGRLAGLFGRRLRQRIEEMLDLAGLIYARHRRVGGFSKGMLQRIGLAQALINDPELVILDEPTAGIDPSGARQIRDLILSLKQAGKTIILTSHLLEQVQQVCDRVGIMSRGKLIREGTLAELLTIKGRTEIELENATPAFEKELEQLAERHAVRIVAKRPSSRPLEKVYLEAAGES